MTPRHAVFGISLIGCATVLAGCVTTQTEPTIAARHPLARQRVVLLCAPAEHIAWNHPDHMERVMAQGSAGLESRHPTVGDVRGIGLFWVIELVKDRETREPLAPWNAKSSELGPMPEVAQYLRRHGLYTFVKWNWIFVVPPLSVNADQIAEGLAVIDGALNIADASLDGSPTS